MRAKYVLRGCAYGDYDNDGFPDILVVENNGPARLWHNEGGNREQGTGNSQASSRNHWIRFKLVGKKSNRDGIGALITLKASGVTQRQWVKSGSSFLSQSSLRVTFGLGKATQVEEVEVLWPSGQHDKVRLAGVDQVVTVEEGTGRAN